MSNNANSGGWTNTDDESPSVRIRAGENAPTNPSPIQSPQSIPHVHNYEIRSSSVQPNPYAMRLSAVAGIAIVLIAMTMIVGIDSLRGNLTESGSSVTTVSITKDNQFSPNNIAVAAGTTLIIENKNANPQVMKVKSGNELFPTQVIFDKPYSFAIPAGTNGTFTYGSETMPQDRILTIVVTPTIEAAAVPSSVSSSVSSISSASSKQETENFDDFPLPFGEPMAAAPTVHSVSPTVTVQEASDMTQIISVGETTSSDSESVSFASAEIPTNPYTVATAKKNGNSSQMIAQATKNLHSGAPLLEMERYRPQSNTSTGANQWIVLIGALLIMTIAYRKLGGLSLFPSEEDPETSR